MTIDTILLARHRAVYIEIPKVACTSIKTALAPILGVGLMETDGNPHEASWPMAPVPERSGALFPGLFAFAFVRNPWDRLVSCYRDKIGGEVAGYTFFDIRPGVANCLARFDEYVAGMSFDAFVRAVASIPDAEADDHFRSQQTFVTNDEGRIAIDFVGRYEQLANDFRLVGQRIRAAVHRAAAIASSPRAGDVRLLLHTRNASDRRAEIPRRRGDVRLRDRGRMTDPVIRASKFLSLLLRHAPDTIGLELDDNGWASIDDLVRLTAGSRTPLTVELIATVVRTNDKQRFRISDDGLRIRANQGHSLDVDLELRECAPPDVLFHGTAAAFLPSIGTDGLVRGERQHVHLSADAITARKVGARHGAPVVLEILAKEMASTGAAFYLSENGVWLTHAVPLEWIRFPDAS